MLFKDAIYPIKPVSFFYDGVRKRRVVHISSELYPERPNTVFDALMTYNSINTEIKTAPLDNLLFFKDGLPNKPTNYLDIVRAQADNESVLRSFVRGSHQFETLVDLEEDIKKKFLSTYAWTNLYWSKKKQALKPHKDPDTIVVLQIHGNKLWDFYGDGIDWKTNEPIHQLTMKQGDFLFFPKGTLHSAVTTGDLDSIHLTIEIKTDFDKGL